MAFEQLSDREKLIVLQAMKAVLEGPYISDAGIRPRLGIDRPQLQGVVDAWPELDDSPAHPVVNAAINNCLNEVLHGVHIPPDEWATRFGAPREEVKSVYQKWAKLKGRSSTGIQ